MRIPSQDAANTLRPEHAVRSTPVLRTGAAAGVERSSGASAADKVELSVQARDLQRAQELAQEAPEVREERVEEARRALQNGTLTLSGRALAESILNEHLSG